MGTFRQAIAIAATPQGSFETLEAVVDTGAFYTWIPAPVLRRLGIAPTFKRQFLLADGRAIERDVGQAVVRLDNAALYTICVFGDEGSEPLLGAVTLEEFGLAADPVNQRLVPMPKLFLLSGGDVLAEA